jgi:protein-S-isoprenylcysteine O-methyltransferase Ste14
VAKVQDHQLVETGLYRYIRHPGYLGQLLIFFGIALSLSNWVSVLLMLLPVICGYWYRIRVEERFMQEQMGETYRAYQQRTARLFPGVY